MSYKQQAYKNNLGSKKYRHNYDTVFKIKKSRKKRRVK